MVFTNDVKAALEEVVADTKPASTFIITDTNVERCVLPRLGLGYPCVAIDQGEDSKTLATACRVWDFMEHTGQTRNSLAIMIGGGMVTDLGGFCAATFKRGMPFVNVPTTLLGAVDAAFGGKTAINYGGLKNEIGCFAPAREVVVSACFFDTLPGRELLSGWAEMLKHSLLDGRREAVSMFEANPSALTDDELLPLLRRSLGVKERIVAADPTEKGLRKVLNLGHTAGHAFEELALRKGRGVPHGFAVARGLVVAAVLSRLKSGLDSKWVDMVARRVRALYGSPGVTCDDYPALLELMHADKKNTGGLTVSFTLLEEPGAPLYDVAVTDAEIATALDISRDLLD